MSGFFRGLLGNLGGLESHAPAAQNLLSDLIDQHGGMSGLIDKLNQSGLADQVQSWASSGPASAAISDITQVFPSDQIEALAEKHGIPPGVVSGLLAKVLPHAVAASAQTDGTDGSGKTDD